MYNIGEKIKRYREDAGMSQKKLGLSLGLSDKAISAYESGRTLPPLETIFKISEILEKPVRFFLIEDDENLLFEERLSRIESLLSQVKKEIEELKKVKPD